MISSLKVWALACALIFEAAAAHGALPPRPLDGDDLFSVQTASDPQVRPGGREVAYVRSTGDVMNDRMSRSIWLVAVADGAQRPLGEGAGQSSPRWSPDGKRLAYVATADAGSPQLFVRWMDSGETARVAVLPEAPGDLAWSRDGAQIAFTMFVPAEGPKLGKPPTKPEGAKWADPLRVVDSLVYRTDSEGYLRPGARQVFVVSSTGGAPRQLTNGPYDHRGPISFAADGRSLILTGARTPDWRRTPDETEIYRLPLGPGEPVALTSRKGIDAGAAVSADGARIAYLGFDSSQASYSTTHLYVMNADGSGRRELGAALDRSFESPKWAADGGSIFVQYADRGATKLARIYLDGRVKLLTDALGGGAFDRPYSSGEFDVSGDVVAFTTVDATHPAELAILQGGATRRLTNLNADLLAARRLGEVRPFKVISSRDKAELDAWMVLPPDYAPGQRRPTILEIHGGPHSSYGPFFSTDMQLYAAAGYVVLYVNARNSTSYGEAWARHTNREEVFSDYEDFISTVDAAIALGVADPQRLYVTGGSYGGYAAAAIIGKTDRFRAAALQKPVINWTAKILTTDIGVMESSHYYGPPPWEDPEVYWKHSPLSLVGQVKTPTLLVVGEKDYRTPVSEAEQYYAALQLRQVPSALIVVPGAGHGSLAGRPSQSAARVSAILTWFQRYGSGAP